MISTVFLFSIRKHNSQTPLLAPVQVSTNAL